MARATIENDVVEIDGLSLEAPGVRGSVQVERGAIRAPVRRGAAASVGPSSTSLDRALRRQRMRTSKTAVLDGTRTTRRGAAKPEPLTLRVTGAAAWSRTGRPDHRERGRDLAHEP